MLKTREQCYSILGLDPTASDEEAKAAYRELVKTTHPDVNKDANAKEMFIEVQSAYDSILNQKFAQPAPPDQFAGFGGFGFQGFGFPAFEVAVNFNKNFTLTIPFIEACLGSTKTIAYNHQAQCPGCIEHIKKHGRPNVMGCSSCGGSGSIERRPNPMVTIRETCRDCGGRGVSLACDTCRGAGSVPQRKQVAFKIHPGTEDDSVFKLDGQGDFDYRNNTYGHFFIHVKVMPHPTMTKNGMDIFSRIKVPYIDCILGKDVEFESIHGNDTMTIPPLTVAGAVIKKPNAGIGFTGSHILTVDIEMPTSVTALEKKLLNKIRNDKLKN